MQVFSNGPSSQELHFPEQSTIRRYYIETNANYITQNYSLPLQDELDSFKFYVVARRNYSLDVPFIVPRFFSQYSSDFGLFSASEEPSNDFFDRGITSTEDAELNDSPFPLSSQFTQSQPTTQLSQFTQSHPQTHSIQSTQTRGLSQSAQLTQTRLTRSKSLGIQSEPLTHSEPVVHSEPVIQLEPVIQSERLYGEVRDLNRIDNRLENLRDTVDILHQSVNRISNKLDTIPVQLTSKTTELELTEKPGLQVSRGRSREPEPRDKTSELQPLRGRSREPGIRGRPRLQSSRSRSRGLSRESDTLRGLSRESDTIRGLSRESELPRDKPLELVGTVDGRELEDKDENPDFSSHFQEPFRESLFDDSQSYPQSPHISPQPISKPVDTDAMETLDTIVSERTLEIPAKPMRTGKVGRPKGSTKSSKSLSNTNTNAKGLNTVNTTLGTMTRGKELTTYKRTDTSNVLYKLNRKGVSLGKRPRGRPKGVRKGSSRSTSRRGSDLKDFTEPSRITSKSRTSRSTTSRSRTAITPVTKTPAITPGDLTPVRSMVPMRRTRHRRPSINSSSLLNSLYIFKRRESDASDWPYGHESVTRSVRYPKRSRLPPSQHWASNVISDGTSVVFLAGVSKSRKHKHRDRSSTESNIAGGIFGNEVPDSSLVLTRENGDVELRLVDKSAEDTPKLRRISDYLQTFSSKVTSVPRRRGRPRKLPLIPPLTQLAPKNRTQLAPKNRTQLVPKNRTQLVPKNRNQLVPSDGTAVVPGDSTIVPSDVVSGTEIVPIEETDVQPPDAVIRKKKLGRVRIRRDLSVDEALEILKEAPMIYDEKGLEISFESPKYTKELSILKRRINRRKNFHQQLLTPEDNFDSFVEDETDRIYYKSIYPPYEDTSQIQQCHIYPMIITHQIRTSILVIPTNETLSLGNIKTNFICGWVCSGGNVVLMMDEVEVQRVQEKELFFLSSFNHWTIENNNS
uniref:Uncharacterized protein n=2 Tax=Theileria parva TaxID=5875 RepID=Q4N2T6_THEPA|eukprot:XP_763895.1 hypothetical protein [Theileria parva strain Muguga]